MKNCSCLVCALLVVHALSFPKNDASFLRVHDALEPIVATPHGLPPQVHRPAEWQHPQKHQKMVTSHAKEEAHEEHHAKEEAHEEHHAKEEAHEEHHAKEASHSEQHESLEATHTGEEATHHKKPEGHEAAHPSEGEGVAHESSAAESESLSLAFLLMGGVGAFMVVFHFANSSNFDIQLSAWRVLNMTVSIFAAVLLYGILKKLIMVIFNPGAIALIVMTLILFVVLFVGSHAFLYKLKAGDELPVRASGIILAHICGFAGMYGFADTRETEFIEGYGTPGMVALILFSAVFISGLIYIMDIVMKKVEEGDSTIDTRDEQGRSPRDQDDLWIETCEEMDDDVFCLAVSFSIVLFFRYLIRGRPMPYEPGVENIGNVTQYHANALGACSLLFAVLVFAGAFVMIRLHSWIRYHGALAKRITLNVQHLNSMIMAWAFLFWAEWQLYVLGWEHTTIGGCLFIAIFLTLFSFFCVVFLNYLKGQFRSGWGGKRAMSSLELALGVLVGFSWERAFDVGFEEIDAKYEHSILGPSLVILLSLALFAIVAPAWRLNILPKVLKLEGKAKTRALTSTTSAQ